MRLVLVLFTLMPILIGVNGCQNMEQSLYLEAGVKYSASFQVYAEPERRLEWINMPDCTVTVFSDDVEIFFSVSPSDTVDLSHVDNASITVVVVSEANQQINPIIKYTYLGMAPFALTVTKSIYLKEDLK